MFFRQKTQAKVEHEQVEQISKIINFIDEIMIQPPSAVDWVSVKDERVQFLNKLPIAIQMEIGWEPTFSVIYPFIDETGYWCNSDRICIKKEENRLKSMANWETILDNIENWGATAKGHGEYSDKYFPFMSFVTWEIIWCKSTRSSLATVLEKRKKKK